MANRFQRFEGMFYACRSVVNDGRQWVHVGGGPGYDLECRN